MSLGGALKKKVAELEAQLDEYEENTEILLDRLDEQKKQLDAVREVRRMLATQCTNSHAVGLLDAALNGEES